MKNKSRAVRWPSKKRLEREGVVAVVFGGLDKRQKRRWRREEARAMRTMPKTARIESDGSPEIGEVAIRWDNAEGKIFKL